MHYYKHKDSMLFSEDYNYCIRAGSVFGKLMLPSVLLVVSLLILSNAHYLLKVSDDETTTSAQKEVIVGDFQYTTMRHRQLGSMYNDRTKKFVTESEVETKVFNVSSKLQKSIGVMAVVQVMILDRENPDDQQSYCKEWIRFASGDGSFETDKTCGKGMAAFRRNDPGMSFITYGESLLVTYSTPPQKPETLKKRVQIKLTNVYDCPSSGSLDSQPLRACKVGDLHSCIPAESFCDGIIDCSDFGDGIGYDESDCPAASFPSIVRKINENPNMLVISNDYMTSTPSVDWFLVIQEILEEGLSKTDLTIFVILPAFVMAGICAFTIIDLVMLGQTKDEAKHIKKTMKFFKSVAAASKLMESVAAANIMPRSISIPRTAEDYMINDEMGDALYYLPWSLTGCYSYCNENGQSEPLDTVTVDEKSAEEKNKE